jgi:nucleotide-binding universal stress UspA family protein
MIKIIAAIDGLKFSESTRDYAIWAAKQRHAHLVGVFLDDFTYHSYKIYDLLQEEGGFSEAKQKRLEERDTKLRESAVSSFETACKKAGIQYTLHHDRSIAIQELLHESIYADLLIVDSSETLTHYPEKVPTRFARDLLSNVQCPVLIVPHKFKPVDRVILLYDGEPSSVFAVKMYSYTLCPPDHYNVEVLSVNSVKESLHLPDNKLMKEFMKRHFPEALYMVLKGTAEIEITNYLKEQKDYPLIVLGAYRRGMVSRWFRSSMADTLMSDLKLPLFIAHNK